MSLLDLTLAKPIPNTLADANQISNGFTTIESLVNGGIDDSNVAAQAITPNRLKQDGAATGQTLAWDGTQWAPSGTGGGTGGVSLVSVLPGAPSDGQFVVFCDNVANPAFTWQLIYVQAIGKWCNIGGSPLYAEVLTDQTATAGTGYVDLATVGPQVTLPVGGDFEIRAGSTGWNSLNAGQNMVTALKVGTLTTVDADCFSNTGCGPSTNQGIGSSRVYRKTGLTSGTVLKLQYKSVGGGPHWASRTISVMPIRVG